MVKVSLFSPRGDFEQIAEAAQLAESVGFDGCFFGEHHGGARNQHPQLPILISALAARTNRLLLGTSILLSPLYEPIQLAESIAMLDRISNGRFVLGIGVGYQPQDFNHFGLSIRHRVSRFEENLEVMRAAWSDGPFSFSGKRFQYENVEVFPKPITKPHPPVWIAAWTDPGAVRAGQLGDAYVTDPIQNLGAIQRFSEIYQESAGDHGRKPEVVLMREFLCADTRSEAEDRYGEALLDTYRYYWTNGAFNSDLEPWVKDIGSADEITFDSIVKDRVIFGTPSDCVGQLEHWISATRADHVELVIPSGPGTGDDAQQVQLAGIKLAGEEIVPRLR